MTDNKQSLSGAWNNNIIFNGTFCHYIIIMLLHLLNIIVLHFYFVEQSKACDICHRIRADLWYGGEHFSLPLQSCMA